MEDLNLENIDFQTIDLKDSTQTKDLGEVYEDINRSNAIGLLVNLIVKKEDQARTDNNILDKDTEPYDFNYLITLANSMYDLFDEAGLLNKGETYGN